MEQAKFIENEYSKMWIQDGVLYVKYRPYLDVTLEIAKICVQDRIKLCNGKTYPMLADGRAIKSFDKDARVYLTEEDAIKYLSAGAFLIKTQIEKFIGNIWFRIDKPPLPARLFTDENEAIKWLQHYKHLN